MRFEITCYTDVGTSRKVNQDAACAVTGMLRGEPVCMVVLCDGMGGASMGEYASRRVVLSFVQWFEREFSRLAREDISFDILGACWEDRLVQLDEELRGYGRRMGIKLGTTATCMLFWRGCYLLAQSGDSRAYEIERRAVQLSEDQSYVQQLIRVGKLTREDAAHHPRRNVLTDCIGGSRPSRPVVTWGRIKRPAVYLLCSDGLIHEVTAGELAHRLAPGRNCRIVRLYESLAGLTELVKSRGERDNITAVGVRVKYGLPWKRISGLAGKRRRSFLIKEKIALFDSTPTESETVQTE